MNMVSLDQIHPVSDFVRNYKAYLSRLKETRKPEVLTVNGVPECVLVDAKSFQEMSEALERVRFINAVQEGIESMEGGKGKSASEAFEGIRNRLGL